MRFWKNAVLSSKLWNAAGIVVSALGLALFSCQPSLATDPPRAPDQAGILSVQIENDLWGSGADRYYTHGTRISYLSSEETPDWLKRGARLVPIFSQTGQLRTSYALGQSIFTPDDTASRKLISDDRPYAGWLYGAVGLISDQRLSDGQLQSNRFDSLELNIGMVGPDAFAEETQTRVHKIIDSPIPQGWDNQLRNELGVMLVYDRQWQAQYISRISGLGIDISPHLSGTLGNVMTSVSGGAMLRVGRDLPSDYGPPTIRPSLAGSGFFQPTHEFGWYLFVGFEGRYVLRNIFLDGNTFRDSHQVDRIPWVGDIQAGLVLTWGNVRLSFSNIFRSDEFEGQQSATEFGSISLSLRL